MNAEIKFKKTPIGEIPEDWVVVGLGEVVHFESGKRPKGGGQEAGEVPSIGGEHIGSDGRIKWENMKFIPKEFFAQLRKGKVKVGDILLVKDGATTGKVAFVEDIKGYSEVAINEHVYLLRPKDFNTLHNLFLFYFMYSPFAQVQIQQAFHGMIGGIKNSELKRLLLFLPPLPEQKKIAEILRTVDNAIEKTDEAIERTERLKNGLMQRLLTKGIKHERFKKTELGEIPEEWQVVRLGEIAQKIKTGPFGSQLRKSELTDRGIKVYTQDNVLRRDFSLGNIYISPEKFKQLKSMEVKPGDILLTIRGTVGKAIVVPEGVEKGIIHTNLAIIRVNPEILWPEYLERIINDSKIIPWQINAARSSTTLPALYAGTIKRLKLPLPPLSEQKQIAEILSTVDRKLELLRRRREKLERVKRGLMRDLLTGRRRVKY
ncbi:restriction modification system DNA specificity subunit [Thermococcus sp. 4557]|uniref:restriction endonuclease subunit S n=1 Tax=Thermococcus sp. (strain CGMCC 1.5172 / 4557) TaxID=1042877 RepID=UPI000219EA96|nr:restriction endonuclease subunit S [Thermococcus sp. 4557]AEK72136.1 restriction modification system DNA specificity subunit [Thermococcus sp. 4557]